MAKTILKFDPDDAFDFWLVGIVCQHKDYRLCHELNRRLFLELVRMDDYELFTPKRMKATRFVMFKYQSDDDDEYFVFSNNPAIEGAGKDDLLVPEQHQMNYFMMIRENFKRIEIQELVNSIRKVNLVLGAYQIDVKGLKSREHFLF